MTREPACLVDVEGAPPYVAWTVDCNNQEVYLRRDLSVTLNRNEAAVFLDLKDAFATLRRVDDLNEAEYEERYAAFVLPGNALAWELTHAPPAASASERLPDCLLEINEGPPPFIAWTHDRNERGIFLRADLRVTRSQARAARFSTLDAALAALRRIDGLNEAEWQALYGRHVEPDHALAWQVDAVRA